MDRLQSKLAESKKILSIYFTAGYPEIDDTLPILTCLEQVGVDMVEIGLPFSDPLADGLTIQESSAKALENGMSSERLFDQLSKVREQINIPLIIMGYVNPILQYGIEAFCNRCAETGIDGLIIPDLPIEIYQERYQLIFETYGLHNIFLITPQTSEARIRYIDDISNSFIYLVSSASTTGAKECFDEKQTAYFERIAAMSLRNPLIVGFGIGGATTYRQATHATKGAIIGSAFIRHISNQGIGQASIEGFIKSIRD